MICRSHGKQGYKERRISHSAARSLLVPHVQENIVPGMLVRRVQMPNAHPSPSNIVELGRVVSVQSGVVQVSDQIKRQPTQLFCYKLPTNYPNPNNGPAL
jgi:hypothetical protein